MITGTLVDIPCSLVSWYFLENKNVSQEILIRRRNMIILKFVFISLVDSRQWRQWLRQPQHQLRRLNLILIIRNILPEFWRKIWNPFRSCLLWECRIVQNCTHKYCVTLWLVFKDIFLSILLNQDKSSISVSFHGSTGFVILSPMTVLMHLTQDDNIPIQDHHLKWCLLWQK